MRPLTVLLAAAVLAVPAPAPAEDAYPSRPIRIIVPLAAGGGTDIVARTIVQAVAEEWQANIAVENRTGGGTVIGAQALLNAPADGYTLMFNTASFLITPLLLAAKPFERSQVVPVSLVAASPHVLVVSRNVPAKDVGELVTWIKSKGGSATFASFGNGSSGHLGTEILLRRLGVQMVHVPYRGNAPALTDVLADHVDLMLADHMDGNIKAGRPRPVAFAGEQRSVSLPDVPTVIESGYPGYVSMSWYGLVARVGTPQAVIDKWHAAVTNALQKPDVRAKLIEQGIDPIGSAPADFARFMDTEEAKYAEVIRAGNIKPGD
ncbi:MAG: tripartite tricarboxylate transporter substrate binding protein [Rhodoplanes sp.]|uniref:Bug family tripartite tricarboxylate transporter substrate binding protein n=1 Tax=Rhodoplanes sp. TaxID=1968906 RepID=UPI0017AF430A|nr:tripartite tricarboxylate transporter substrate binding protein [Rhodoplanes sp.]NVO14301.1 tripartite tricarboxylate transporter substrate binding protein [Rhodoplanes sp.]